MYHRVDRAFLSTLSLRRATAGLKLVKADTGISIHALLAESDYMCPIISTITPIISIHALLAESDLVNGGVLSSYSGISIHALLAESDLWVLRKVPLLGIFLSTLSLRRATFGEGE